LEQKLMLKKKLLIAAALLAALSTQAEAQTISADSTWHEFDVDDLLSSTGGLEWIDLDGNPLTFDFTLTQSTVLDVVDAGFGGDRFALDFTGPINFITRPETSSALNTYDNSIGLNFDAAFANQDYSKFSITLLAGTYTLSGELIESVLYDPGTGIPTPLNATVGAVRLTPAAVPLPAAAWLYITGTALMGFISRRRNANV
jgi:hypothetical protein